MKGEEDLHFFLSRFHQFTKFTAKLTRKICNEKLLEIDLIEGLTCVWMTSQYFTSKAVSTSSPHQSVSPNDWKVRFPLVKIRKHTNLNQKYLFSPKKLVYVVMLTPHKKTFLRLTLKNDFFHFLRYFAIKSFYLYFVVYDLVRKKLFVNLNWIHHDHRDLTEKVKGDGCKRACWSIEMARKDRIWKRTFPCTQPRSQLSSKSHWITFGFELNIFTTWIWLCSIFSWMKILWILTNYR